MPNFSNFRRSNTRRASPSYGQPVMDPATVNMINAQQGMAKHAALHGGEQGYGSTRQPSSRTGASQPGVFAAGEQVHHIQRADGALIPVAAVTGDPYLVRGKGGSTLHSPRTGEEFGADPTSPVGISSLTRARAEAAAIKQSQAAKKEEAKAIVALAKEETAQAKDAAKIAEAAHKLENARATDQLIREGRAYTISRETGAPLPKQSDEEFKTEKAEKMKKLQAAAALKPIKGEIDRLKHELNNPDLPSVKAKDVEEAEEAMTSAAATLQASRGTADYDSPVTKEELEEALADPARRPAAAAYIQAQKDVETLPKVLEQRKKIERQLYNLEGRALDPIKYSEELKARISTASDDDLHATAASIQAQAKARHGDLQQNATDLKKQDDDLAAQHANATANYEKAKLSGDPRILGTAGDALSDIEQQADQWLGDTVERRAAIEADNGELARDQQHLKMVADELSRRRATQVEQHAATLERAAPGSGEQYKAAVTDASKRAAALRAKYADPEAEEAKKAFEALEKDVQGKIGGIVDKAASRQQTVAQVYEGMRSAEISDQKANTEKLTNEMPGFKGSLQRGMNAIGKMVANADPLAASSPTFEKKGWYEAGVKAMKASGGMISHQAVKEVQVSLGITEDQATQVLNDVRIASYNVHSKAAREALKQALGVDDNQAQTMLDDQAQMDWRGAGTALASKDVVATLIKAATGRRPGTMYVESEPTRLLSDGRVTVNPKLVQYPDIYAQAVKNSGATPEQQAQAMKELPDARQELGKRALELFQSYSGSGFKEWLAKQPKGKGTTPVDQALAYADHLRDNTGPIGKLLDQVVTRLQTGVKNLGVQGLGMYALATGSESAAKAAGSISKGISQQTGMLEMSGANDSLLNRVAGTTADIAPGVLVTMGAGIAARGATLAFAGTKVGANILAKLSGVLAKAATAEEAAAAVGSLANTAGFYASAVAGGAQTAGAQFADTYAALRDQGYSHEDAVKTSRMPALISGAVTSLLTISFGKTGVERIFADPATKAAVKSKFRSLIGGVVKGGLEEQPEELIDELYNQVSTEMVSNPHANLLETVQKYLDQLPELALAVGVMGAVGGGMQARRDWKGGTDQPTPEDMGPDANAPTGGANPEDLVGIDAEISGWNPEKTTLPNSVQDALKASFGKDATPEQTAEVAQRAAHALVAIGQGKDPRTMSAEVRRVLGIKINTQTGAIEPASKNVMPMVESVADSKGKHHAVILDSAREWLTNVLPDAGASIKLDYAGRVAQIQQPPAKPVKKPVAKKAPAAQTPVSAEQPVHGSEDVIPEASPVQVTGEAEGSKISDPAPKPSATEQGKRASAEAGNPDTQATGAGKDAELVDDPNELGGWYSEQAKLPRELASAKPRYSYGDKQFTLEFKTDADRAAYITAQDTPSKRDADYLAFAMKHTGLTGPEVRELGGKLKAFIKRHASMGKHGETIQIPQQWMRPIKTKLEAKPEKPQPTKKAEVPRGTVEPTDAAAHAAATSEKNDLPQPTDAQKQAGNYQLGHITVGGLDISIENPHGSARKWTNAAGESGENVMNGHYGYIKGTVGNDSDHIDALVKEGTPADWNGTAFVIHQNDPKTGKFDEHKVYIGFASAAEAKAAYLSNYQKGWKGFGGMENMTMAELAEGVKIGAFRPQKNVRHELMHPDEWVSKSTIIERKGETLTFKDPAGKKQSITGSGKDTNEELIRFSQNVALSHAFQAKRPVLAAIVDGNNGKVPDGYVREGDLYVFNPKTTKTANDNNLDRTKKPVPNTQSANVGMVVPPKGMEAVGEGKGQKAPLRVTTRLNLTGGALIEEVEKQSHEAVFPAMQGDERKRGEAAREALISKMRDYNGKIPMDVGTGGLTFAWQDGTVVVNPSLIVETTARDATSPDHARRMVNALFRHEVIHDLVVSKVPDAQVREIWDALKPGTRAAVLKAYSARLLALGYNRESLSSFQGGHEYLRAMVEAALDGETSEMIMGEGLGEKWRALLDTVLTILKDIRRQFSAVKAKDVRERLIADVDAIVKDVTESIRNLEKSISPTESPAQETNGGAESTSGKPVTGSSATVARKGSRRNAKPSSAEVPPPRPDLDSPKVKVGDWISDSSGAIGPVVSFVGKTPVMGPEGVNQGEIDPQAAQGGWKREEAPATDASPQDAGDTALNDAFKGLFAPPSSPTPTAFTEDLPADRMEAMMKAARVLVDLKLATPQELGARFDKMDPSGNARRYSAAFWKLLQAFNGKLPDVKDWTAIYAASEQPSGASKQDESESKAPESGTNQPDSDYRNAVDSSGKEADSTTDDAGTLVQRPDSAESGDADSSGSTGTEGDPDSGRMGGEQSGQADSDGEGQDSDSSSPGSAGAADADGSTSPAGQPDAPERRGDDGDIRRAEPVAVTNYVITPKDDLGSGGVAQKFADNMQAIHLLKELERHNRKPTHEEQSVLVRYVGWGGMKQAFNTKAKGWESKAEELQNLLTPDEYSNAKRSTMDAHYTSPTIIQKGIWAAMLRFGFMGGKMLEGGVGLGHMIGFMPADFRAATSYLGIEKDSITSRIAALLYPESRILSMGFEQAKVETDHFDGAVGNPPFGQQSLYDPNHKDIARFSIHNYFIAKHLAALRPGGVASFVVSHYFLDALDSAAREHIATKAQFLGAIRLPNNAFTQNAGTKVTTDIVYFQRTEDGSLNTTDWTKATKKQTEDGDYSLSTWIESNPDMILGELTTDHGMHAIEMMVKPRPGQNLGDDLAAAVEKLPANIYRAAGEDSKAFEAPEEIDVPDVPVGGYFTDPDTGTLRKRLPDSNMVRRSAPVDMPAATTERVKGMIGIREKFNDLVAGELSDANGALLDALRDQLNMAYDAFVKKYGFLNQMANRRAFYADPQSARILGLEVDFNPGISKDTAKKKEVAAIKPSAKKADIFTRRVNAPYVEITHVDTAKEALTASLNQRGGVDVPYMEAISGLSHDALIGELDGLVFENPNGGFEVSDHYLSGNVRRKLTEAREAAAGDNRFAPNVTALEAVQPPDLTPSQVSISPGAPFIPTHVFNAFATELTGEEPQAVVYIPSNGAWSFQHRGDKAASTETWGTGRARFGEIFQNILNNKPTVIYDTDSDDKRVLNPKATELARSKEMAIKNRWKAWVWEDAERASELLRLYNDIYNVYVDPKYDGSHLSLPGMSSVVDLRPHQKNVVWRIMNELVVLLDHVVGAGKTFAGIAGFMELRRTGRIRKPMFAVPNHLVTQWRDDFLKLYPNANVLFARPSDFKKDKRQLLFAKIMSGAFDAVIVGHSSLKKIGMSPAIESDMLREMLAEITDTLAALAEAEGRTGTRVQTQLERQKEAMEAKLARLADNASSGGQDAVANFEELGIDALFVDEAHEFKNLFYTTQMTNVAGLGNAAGSAKAFDLFLKTRYLRQRYNNRAPIVFATGTPISNSLVEMFTMQRYLQPQELARMGISTLDAWAKIYAQVDQVEEVDPTGTSYRVSTRLAKFQNAGDLAMNYRTFADVITMNDLKAQAEVQGKKFPVPKVRGGKPQGIIVPRTKEQADFYGVETQRVTESGEPILDGEGNPLFEYPPGTINWRVDNMPDDPREDNMLKLTNDARKAALDMRLINPDTPDRPTSKINQTVKNILTIAKEWDADKGTQLVFCDLSVPASARGKAKAKATAKLNETFWIQKGGRIERVEKAEPITLAGFEDVQFFIRKDGREWTVTERSTGSRVSSGANKSDAAGNAAARLDSLGKERFLTAIEQLKPDAGALAAFYAAQEELNAQKPEESDEADTAEEKSEESVSVDELLAEQSKFSVYDDIKAKLIAAGLPPEQVAFIHDFDSPEKKSALFARMNRGDVRVLLGSTAKLGAGTNVQRKLVALHHMDAPWRPSDLEQREGRIVRQGNEFYERDPENFEVRVLRYATKLTYDTRMWQIIEHKAAGIEGFRKADRNTRVIDDVSGEAANAADMKAASSGDPRIQQEIVLRGEVTKLRNLQAAWQDNRHRAKSRVDYLAKAEDRYEGVRKHWQGLIDTRDAGTTEQFLYRTPGGNEITEKAEILRPIVDIMKGAKPQEEVAIGRYRGFILFGKKYTRKGTQIMEISATPVGQSSSRSMGVTHYTEKEEMVPSGFITRVDNFLAGFEERIESARYDAKRETAEYKDLLPTLNTTFDEGGKLEETMAAHAAIKAQLMGSRRKVDTDEPTEATSLAAPPTRAEAGSIIRRFEQDFKPFFTYANDAASTQNRKAALRSVMDRFASEPGSKELLQAYAELPTAGLMSEDVEHIKAAKELLAEIGDTTLSAPPSGYRTPAAMLAGTAATMKGMDKPAAPSFGSKDMHAAYKRARGPSTAYTSIRSVFDEAKKANPSLRIDEFKSQLKADYYAGLVGLEPSEQSDSTAAAGQFTMRDTLGVVHTNMVFMPTTYAEMIEAAGSDDRTPADIMQDLASSTKKTESSQNIDTLGAPAQPSARAVLAAKIASSKIGYTSTSKAVNTWRDRTIAHLADQASTSHLYPLMYDWRQMLPIYRHDYAKLISSFQQAAIEISEMVTTLVRGDAYIVPYQHGDTPAAETGLSDPSSESTLPPEETEWQAGGSERARAVADTLGAPPIDPAAANQGDTEANREFFAQQRGRYIAEDLEQADFDEIRTRMESEVDADEQGHLDNILYKVENGEELTIEEEVARRILANRLRSRGTLEDDANLIQMATRLWAQDITAGTENARKLAMRVDQFEAPQDRLNAAIGRIIAPNTSKLRARTLNAWTPSAKRREIARLRGEIASAQTDLSRERLERKLAEAQARLDKDEEIQKLAAENEKNVAKVLSRLGLAASDLHLMPEDRRSMQVAVMDMPHVRRHIEAQTPAVQQAIEMSVRGYSDDAIARDTGLPVGKVERVTEEFRTNIAKQAISQTIKTERQTFGGLIEAGKNLIKWILKAPAQPLGRMVNAGVPNAANIQNQVLRILNAAIPTRRQRNRRTLHAVKVNGKNGQKITVFIPYDPTDWKQVYRVARELSTRDATYRDKAYEYWINGILSGMQTHVVNTASNLLSTAWHYGPQWFSSATVNTFVRDPHSTQWGEFPRLLGGFLKGIQPAMANFALAWHTEADPVEYQYLDKPVTAVFNGGQLDKIGGRGPAIGGATGRVVRVPGRFLVAADAFAKTLIMHGESAAYAYRLGKERGLAGAALENYIASQIATYGSDSWAHALETATELTFQDENEITKNVEKVINSAKQLKVVGLLFKFLFPFVRTPTNIYRTGIRKAGGSAGMLLWRLGEVGFYKMKEGTPFFDTYPKGRMVKDISESVMAAILWMGLMGLSEGDVDDEDKLLSITGTRPYGVANAGERASQMRQEGGSNLIILRRNPLTGKKLDEPMRIPYGRYEPLALAVSSIVDAAREFKQWTRNEPGSQGVDKLAGTIMQHLAAQAQDRTFLQGVAALAQLAEDITTNRLEPGQALAKQVVNGLVPNLVRQVMSKTRPQMPDSKKPHEVLGSTTLGITLSDTEPKINEAGKPVTRMSGKITSALFPVATDPSKELFDSFLKDWNNRNPSAAWNPDPLTKGDWYIYDPKQASKKGRMPLTSGKSVTRFESLVGINFAKQAAASLLKLGYRAGARPTAAHLEAVKDARTAAIKSIRAMPPSVFVIK